MANDSAYASANGSAPLLVSQDSSLLHELSVLQRAIIDGEKLQFRLSPAAVEQLRESVAKLSSRDDPDPSQSTQHAIIPGLYQSDLDPIFLEKSDSLVRAEGQLKRQRIERVLSDQVEKRKQTGFGERDGQTVNVDNVLARAQDLVVPVSGLKSRVVINDNSSFDENDYYSSQVESDWSSGGVSLPPNTKRTGQDFAAHFEQATGFDTERPVKKFRISKPKSTDKVPVPADTAALYTADDDEAQTAPEEVDDEYIPQEPVTGDDTNAYHNLDQITPPEDDAEASDYEPGEVSQQSDEYTPEYAPAPIEDELSPQVPVIRNHLTQIVAPQPNRVSPLAVRKNQSYELELVNGRPEVIKKARSRYDTDQARQSSASPPVNSGLKSRRQKGKKRKREAEQNGKSKRRDRRTGLDTSAQYPQAAMKEKPVPSPHYLAAPRYVQPVNTIAELASVQHPQPHQQQQQQQQPYEQVVYPSVGASYVPVPHMPPPPPPVPVRSSSVLAQRVVQRDDQDLRRVATLHHIQQTQEYRPYSPIGPYVQAIQSQPARLRESHMSHAVGGSALMPPPPQPAAPKRVVVDQYGNRYYAAEPEPSTMQASASSDIESGHYERAPSRMSTVHIPSSVPYDPSDARIEHLHPPVRTAATPAYAANGEGRMHKIRGQRTDAQNEPTSPVFEQRVQYQQFVPQYAQPAIAQGFENMPPPPMVHPQYIESSHQMFAQPPPPPHHPPARHVSTVQATPRAFSVQPEYAQSEYAQPAYPPRQGSVAPVQYIRQTGEPQLRAMSVVPTYPGAQQLATTYGFAPQPHVRYVDAHGYEIQPSQMH